MKARWLALLDRLRVYLRELAFALIYVACYLGGITLSSAVIIGFALLVRGVFHG